MFSYEFETPIAPGLLIGDLPEKNGVDYQDGNAVCRRRRIAEMDCYRRTLCRTVGILFPL